jgi:hypothetical protein
MLKFSGFADLTSCLEQKTPFACIKGSATRHLQRTKSHGGPICHAAAGLPHSLHASRAQKPLSPTTCREKRKKQSRDTQTHRGSLCLSGTQEAMLSERRGRTLKQACFQGYPESTVYVQVPVGSRNSAIHNAYRSSLRPSSLFEPRHRSLKVVMQQRRAGPAPTGSDNPNIARALGGTSL